MRRTRLLRWTSLLLCTAFLLLCAPVALAGGEELTILFTTDIHANVTPYRTALDGEVATVGGFARLKTAIDQNRTQDNTLLLDSGDFPIGTMYQNFFLGGSVELPLMQQLGYDAVALGNHDFDYGEDGLRQCLAAFSEDGGSLDFLCANLIEKGGAVAGDQYTNPLQDYGVANYKIIERGGVRIGLFGLIGEDAKSYIVTDDLDFADPAATAETYVQVLREKEQVDLVILLSHCGTMPGTNWTEDEDLAKAVKGIDLIVSGHSHAALNEPLEVNGTAIVCAGTALKYLGKLSLERVGGDWRVKAHELIPLTEDIDGDAGIEAVIQDYTDRIDEDYLHYYGVEETSGTLVASSPCTFPTGNEMCTSLEAYPFSQLLMDAYDYALTELCHEQVDLAILAVGSVRSTLYKGDVSVSEIYNVLGYGDSPVDGRSGSPVITAWVTGRELYDIAETSASLSSIVSAAQLFLSGMRYTVDEGRPLLDRVYKVELLDRDTDEYYEIDRDDTLYRVACSYSAANLISLVKSSSFGLFSVSLRDESGVPIAGEELLDHIAHYTLASGESRELKEWYALYAYIMAQPENENGLHVIPARYETEKARYLTETDKGVGVFFLRPSKPAKIIFSVILALIAVIVLIVVFSIRRKHKKKAQAA